MMKLIGVVSLLALVVINIVIYNLFMEHNKNFYINSKEGVETDVALNLTKNWVRQDGILLGTTKIERKSFVQRRRLGQEYNISGGGNLYLYYAYKSEEKWMMGEEHLLWPYDQPASLIDITVEMIGDIQILEEEHKTKKEEARNEQETLSWEEHVAGLAAISTLTHSSKCVKSQDADYYLNSRIVIDDDGAKRERRVETSDEIQAFIDTLQSCNGYYMVSVWLNPTNSTQTTILKAGK